MVAPQHILLGTSASASASAPSPKQYPYTPLDPSRNEIRLLRACKPFEVDGLVSFTLVHVSLDQDPSYEALSYTWGDQNKNVDLSKLILVDGHAVMVTGNLEAALRSLNSGDGDEDRALWVDAICINQTDVTERNEQVRKMQFVYRRAQGVIAWLGEEYEHSGEAFRLLHSFLEVGVQKSLHHGPDPWTADTIPSEEVIKKTHAIVKLFSRDYWSRAWIVQEVAFAEGRMGLQFRCGAAKMSFKEMAEVREMMVKEWCWIAAVFSATSIAYLVSTLVIDGPALVLAARKLHKEQGFGLCDLLIRYQVKKATDPRDKVYSLLSFVSDEKQRQIPLDYSLETGILYRNVARFIIMVEKSLRLLAENKTPQGEYPGLSAGTHLPSWVPNWANEDGTWYGRVDNNSSWMSTAGLTEVTASMREDDVLCVKGVRLGTVTKTSPATPELDGENTPFRLLFENLYEWWLMFLASGKTELFGKDGFLDFLMCGDPGTVASFEEQKDITIYHIRVIMALFELQDETLTSILGGKHTSPIDENLAKAAESDVGQIVFVTRKRKAFHVGKTNYGIGPQGIEEGDMAVVLFGCKVPLILRKRTEEDGGGYINIGDAYVGGFMNGEAIKDLEDGKREAEIFEIH